MFEIDYNLTYVDRNRQPVTKKKDTVWIEIDDYRLRQAGQLSIENFTRLPSDFSIEGRNTTTLKYYGYKVNDYE